MSSEHRRLDREWTANVASSACARISPTDVPPQRLGEDWRLPSGPACIVRTAACFRRGLYADELTNGAAAFA